MESGGQPAEFLTEVVSRIVLHILRKARPKKDIPHSIDTVHFNNKKMIARPTISNRFCNNFLYTALRPPPYDPTTVKRALRSSILSFARLTKDLRVRGRQNIPSTGPVIFVSLHRTDADPILVSAAVRREVLWVYASFLDQVPVLGRLLRRYGFVAAAYREITGIRSVREMVTALTAGKALGIFPEGATPLIDPRGGDGHRFSSSFARLAILTGSPVVPVVIAARRVTTRSYPLPRPLRRRMGLPAAAAEVPFRRVLSGVTVHFDRPRTLDPQRPYREQAQAVHRRLLELRDMTTAQSRDIQEQQ